MNKKSQFPTREELDQAFHFLHDAINKIAVQEEQEEMALKENDGLEE
jgi:hypothetical protein